LNKKLGTSAIIACVVIVGVLAFTYNNTNQTTLGKSQQSNTTSSAAITPQPNITNSITASPPTTGKHFFAGINENVTVTSNP
jgi:hypothetical protein